MSTSRSVDRSTVRSVGHGFARQLKLQKTFSKHFAVFWEAVAARRPSYHSSLYNSYSGPSGKCVLVVVLTSCKSGFGQSVDQSIDRSLDRSRICKTFGIAENICFQCFAIFLGNSCRPQARIGVTANSCFAKRMQHRESTVSHWFLVVSVWTSEGTVDRSFDRSRICKTIGNALFSDGLSGSHWRHSKQLLHKAHATM